MKWWSYWEESVPKLSTFSVPRNLSRNSISPFKLRDIYDGVYFSNADSMKRVFPARLRLNGRGDIPVSYGGAIVFGKPALVHSFAHYFPPDKYFPLYPDWFIYDVKQKKRIKSGQLCLSNAQLLDSFKTKVQYYINASFEEADKAGKEPPLLYSVSLNDNSTLCACDECAATIKKSGPSGYVLKFVNKIAEFIKPIYPEVKIETLSYLQYLEVPTDDTKPADNVLIRLADDERDILNTIEHPNNKNVLRRLNDWAAITGKNNLVSWDYMLTYYMNPPLPNMFRVDDDARLLLNKKAWGYFTEIERPVTNDMGIMKYWVVAKILENPRLKAETVIDEFIKGYYGPAAKYIREYLYGIKAAADKSGMGLTFKRNFVYSNYITYDLAVNSNRLFEWALAAVKGDVDFERRVRHARNALDRVIVFGERVFENERKKRGQSLQTYSLNSAAAANRLVTSLREMKALVGPINDEIDMEIDYFTSVANNNNKLPEELKGIPPDKISVIRPAQLINAYKTGTLVNDKNSINVQALRMDIPIIKLPVQLRVIERGPNMNYNMKTERTFTVKEQELSVNYKLHKIPDLKLADDDYLVLFYTWTVTTHLGYFAKYGRTVKPGQLYDMYVSMRLDGPKYGNNELKNDVLFMENIYIVAK